MAAGEWDGVLGIRRDIDLNQRWWHRLAKVVYFLILGLVISVCAFIIWDASASDDFPAQRKQIKILTTLDTELQHADDNVPNVVPVFLSTKGRLGYDGGSKYVQQIYDFELEKTLCSPAPLQHLGSIAAFLNNRDYTNGNTSESIARGILQGRKPQEAKNLCWMHESIRNKDFDKIIKYEFTTTGFLGALWNYSFLFIAWIAGIHVVLLNFYYRGVVFVIVGPRKNIPSPKDDDDIDDELD